LYVWNGNHYALPFTESAGLETGGTIRVGALHYNSREEIDRLVTALREYQG
jgi:selenocysteine lyase/cysteine desulfurase